MTSLPAVLITGASTGIGASYAERFAARGHDLVLVARDRAKLEALAQELRGKRGVAVDILAADLTAAEERAAVEARLRDDDRIGILINNAGASAAGGFLDQAVDAVENLIALNAVSLTRLARVAAQRFAAEGRGAIVNVSSVVGLAPELALTVYGATKAFVLFLSQGLQQELAGKGVYVQAVLPSATRTAIWEKSGRNVDDLQGVMEVEELVDAALVGFDRREAVSIPSLPDAGQWDTLEAARKAILPNVLQTHAAARYRDAA